MLLTDFTKDHKVLVGDQWVPIADLPFDPERGDFPGVTKVVKKMQEWVGKFQRYQYDD
jgi:hypothetical protein